MDPLSAISVLGSISQLVIKICQALKNMKDLKSDAEALRKLVCSVQSVTQNAATELDSGQLCRPDAQRALKGVEESLAICLQLVQKQAAKSSVIKFFAAGDYQAELKTATSNMAHQLQVLQMALGVEQHADLKQQFEQLRKSMMALKLETLSSMEKHAADFRFTVEKGMAAGGAASQQNDERLRRLLLECLEQAGVGRGGVAAGGQRVFTQEDIDNAVLEISREIEERRKNKEAQEANYLAQIAEILKSAPPRPQRQQAGSSGGAGSSKPLKTSPTAKVPPAVPQNFLCPITLQIMRDPVMLVESGHSFERAAIERHLATSRTNPVTNLPLASRSVAPNIGLRGAIEEWFQHKGLTADQADNLPQQPSPQQRPRPPSDAMNSLQLLPVSPSPADVVRQTSELIWSGAEETVLQGHTSAVTSVSWSPDGRSLASGSADNSIRIWSVDSGRCNGVLEGHTKPVWSVSWSPDGGSLASGSIDNSIRIWNVVSAKCKATLEGHKDWVTSVSWSPDGRSLASGSGSLLLADTSVRIWDVASGRCKATLEGHTSVSWSPDGRSLASGSWNRSVRIWNVASGRCKATLEGHTNAVRSVSWSPDSRSLASGSSDNSVRIWNASIRIWNVVSAKCKATLEGHMNAVTSVSWSPDGRSLASGSGDNTIRIWDVASAECKATLEGHTNLVWSVSWSPDGRTLASGSDDNTIRLWKARSRS